MKHGQHLPLERCPHCSVAKPRMDTVWHQQTQDHAGHSARQWGTYRCFTCGGVTLAVSPHDVNFEIANVWPSLPSVADTVPSRARSFLEQAIASIHAPSGAVMLTSSSIDAMLKEKGLKQGTLNSRIDEAAQKHLITPEMAAWAHEIRLDANDQRHADEATPLPTEADAHKAIEFANALAQ
ncbi:MAG: DUF4145 domain-containing protein, partial [Gammaproteobacteria bacterium]